MLARTDLRQLAQRITGRYHLEPLNEADTEKYIQHRMRVAGATREIFSKRACRELYKLSGGIPRIINVIADRALLGAYTLESPEIGARMIRQAAAETYNLGEDSDDRRSKWWKIGGVVAAICLLLGVSIYSAIRYADGRVAQAVSSTTPADAGLPPNPDTATPVTDVKLQTTAAVLEEFIRTHPEQTDTKTAFRNLFSLWSTPFDVGSERACEYAETKGLFCILAEGPMAQLQTLNHPAILTLTDYSGNAHQVVLASIAGATATVYAGAELMTVPLDEVMKLWDGDYLLLWRPQIGSVKSFTPGMQDPDVVWLRESLAAIQGSPVEPVASEYFDDVLEARVREYQVSRNLTVDGLVGPKTQILINADLGIEAPRLEEIN
jgi:general secretion pathway protein A